MSRAAAAATAAPKGKVIGVAHIRSTDPARMGQEDTIITYQDSNGQRYAVTIPLSSPTPAQVSAAIKDHYKNRVAPIMSLEVPLG
jgi:hypothetical protein